MTAGETSSARADAAACRAMIAAGSKSFHAASLALPPSQRGAVYALYAFCRLSDDAVDGADQSATPGARAARLAAVARLRGRLDRVYAGTPDNAPPDRALARVAASRGLPRPLLDALLEGLEWDAVGRRYETISDLRAYGARVAGAVGALMAALMGVRSPFMAARACDLGVAMQLTNIARDVGEDARMGRLYLPREWMREEGLNPDAFLAAPRHSIALGRVVQRVLAEADRLYGRAGPGIGRLPLSCRPAIWAARYIYAEIGREVARRDHDSIRGRAVTSSARKAALLGKALLATALPPRAEHAPPLPETRFLVDALGIGAGGVVPTAWWDLDRRIAFVSELFVDLERLERDGGAEALARRRGEQAEHGA